MISRSPFFRTGFRSYPSALQYLYNINAKLRADGVPAPSSTSLANTMSLYELIGKPLDRIPTIHVGGTNGKGTTCFKLAESLRLNGFKTGLFVSPHISSYRERIQVDNTLLPEDDFVNLFNNILELCNEHSIPATFFEITFILSCLKFEQSSCDAVVLEVGVGGEWDATNVITSSLSVICSVGLDHTRFLGDTVEKIAKVKAGIFKPKGIALIGPECPYDVINGVAAERCTTLYTLNDCLVKFATNNYIPPLNSHPLTIAGGGSESANGPSALRVKDSDLLNAQLVLASLCLLKEKMTTVADDSTTGLARLRDIDLSSPRLLDCLQSTRPPCRWEVFQVQVFPPVDNSSSSAGPHCSSKLPRWRIGDADHPHDEAHYTLKVILDIAHNPPAIKSLMDKVADCCQGTNVRVLCGMSRDKDVAGCLRMISSVVPKSNIHFVQSSNFRALSIDALQAILGEVGEDNTSVSEEHSLVNMDNPVGSIIHLLARDVERTRATAGLSANSCEGVLVVCGSGYLMSQVRQSLGIKEPSDKHDLPA